jgi:hypothetical protein
VLSQNARRLEHAIHRDAVRNIRSHWHGRYRFGVHTECRPTNPDGFDWSCTTTVSSSRPGTRPCRIKTTVSGNKRRFRYDAPQPFTRNVLYEGCPTLDSELPRS